MIVSVTSLGRHSDRRWDSIHDMETDRPQRTYASTAATQCNTIAFVSSVKIIHRSNALSSLSSPSVTRCVSKRIRVSTPRCTADAASFKPNNDSKNNNNNKGPVNSVKQPSSSTTDEDERLQNDRPFIMREFGKVSAIAVGIGLILFCFDIIVSLLALSFAAVYGLAVLFDIRFITQSVKRGVLFFSNLRQSVMNMVHRLVKRD